ncbi:MAG: WbuC family cupin fold metalloprotein [Prevotellaceae bacterium]|jgi:cupin fold WbuC family metalloprotein|nr:WbuC family cupin fold metalloprotein [Prevotellaceae bacterium]
MKIIDKALLDSVSAQAVKSPRLRMNYNFHLHTDEPLNRLLNAMEPGSYFPPHRHKNPDKEEIFLVLRGSVLILIFDDDGFVASVTEISPKKEVYGMEIEAGVWHSLIVLEPDTVVYEVKRGPYVPLTPDNIAPWAPDPADRNQVNEFLSADYSGYLAVNVNNMITN